MAIFYDFIVGGSPISVNRYGTHPYRIWRQAVYAASVLQHAAGILINSPTTVSVRYFQGTDRQKDVDNILKAILDALDGRRGPGRGKQGRRILADDRSVERITSQRTSLRFHSVLNGAHFSGQEYAALVRAHHQGAAIYVRLSDPPNHGLPL